MFEFSVIAFDCIDSTNAEAVRRAGAGAPEGTLVCSGMQTAGRGRGGRTWISPRGNLYCSVLLRPQCSLAIAPQLGFVAGVALAETVDECLGGDRQVACKWPNDVLVSGRKIAGILLESAATANGRPDWVVIGAGVNIASCPDALETAFPATSLQGEGARDPAPETLLGGYRHRLMHWLAAWWSNGFAVVRAAWLGRAYKLQERIGVRLDGETRFGVFLDLDHDGALLLGEEGGIRRIAAGDVFPPGS